MSYHQKLENDHAYQVLTKLTQQGKFPQNILLTGTQLDLKEQLTKYYLQAVFCQNKIAGSPCQTCQDCHFIEQKQHPDVYWYEKGAKLGKDEIVGIQARTSESGLIGKYRAYVIEQLDTMTSQAQNAWLKFLEEPLPNIYCLAWIENENQILATVKSRFLRLHMMDKNEEKSEIPEQLAMVVKAFIERYEEGKEVTDLMLFLEKNIKINEEFSLFLEILLQTIVVTNQVIVLVPLISKVKKMLQANVPQDQVAVYFCLNAYCEENNDEYSIKS